MATGWWPPNIPFEAKELATVIAVFKDQEKELRRANRR